MSALKADGEKLLFEANNVTGDYVLPGSVKHAVDACFLKLKKGDVVGLVGESGCGKSTLGKLLQGYDKPPLRLISGNVSISSLNIYSMSIKQRSRTVWGTEISRIPQYSMNSLNPVAKIKTLVQDFFKSKALKIPKKQAISTAKNMFEKVGLKSDLLERYPFELSGGMKQRAVTAISILLNPKVVIADEPTTALDVTTQRRLIEFLHDLVKKGIVPSMIFISHDIATLAQICNYFYVMYAAEIIEYGKREDVTKSPLHPYTKLLISTIPTLDSEVKRKRGLKDISGFPPDLSHPPAGCRFRERCPSAMDVCKKMPSYYEVNNGRVVKCWLFENEGKMHG